MPVDERLLVRPEADDVRACNDLARQFYLAYGRSVREGFRFDLSGHPEEQQMFTLAVIALNYSAEYGL